MQTASAGLVLVARPATMAMVTPWTGWQADRVQPRLLVATGLGLHAAGLVALSQLGGQASLGVVMAVLIASALRCRLHRQ